MTINYPNAELKQTSVPGKLIGWREHNGSYQPIEVTVQESAVLVEGIEETVTLTVTTKVLQTLNPAGINNEG